LLGGVGTKMTALGEHVEVSQRVDLFSLVEGWRLGKMLGMALLAEAEALGLCFLFGDDLEKVAFSRKTLLRRREIETGVRNAN
jgi:hypothetical protein